MTPDEMRQINENRYIAAWRTIGAVEAIVDEMEWHADDKDRVLECIKRIRCYLAELDEMPKVPTSPLGQ